MDFINSKLHSRILYPEFQSNFLKFSFASISLLPARKGFWERDEKSDMVGQNRNAEEFIREYREDGKLKCCCVSGGQGV